MLTDIDNNPELTAYSTWTDDEAFRPMTRLPA